MSDSSNNIDDDNDGDDMLLFAAVREWADAQEDDAIAITTEGNSSGRPSTSKGNTTSQALKEGGTDIDMEGNGEKKDNGKKTDKKKKKTKKDRKKQSKSSSTTAAAAAAAAADYLTWSDVDKHKGSNSGGGVHKFINDNPSSSKNMFQRPHTQQKKFSLHVTNLPYTATKNDIIKIFTDHGCKVTSTRLVYNYHKTTPLHGNANTKKSRLKSQSDLPPLPSDGFTGVAFIDLVDQVSFENGLKLDKASWSKAISNSKGTRRTTGKSSNDKNKNDTDNGTAVISGGGKWGGKNRRMNVRPTRTKEELANIVKRTKEKLANAREQENKQNSDSNTSQQKKQTKPKAQPKKRKEFNSNRKSASGADEENKPDKNGSKKRKKSAISNGEGEKIKQHKKQKNNKKKRKDTVIEETATKTLTQELKSEGN